MNPIRNLWENLGVLKELSADDLLDVLGLERRRASWIKVLPAMGAFGAGVVVGAGAALLLTPLSGPELRQVLKDRINEKRESFSRSSDNNGQQASGPKQTSGATAS